MTLLTFERCVWASLSLIGHPMAMTNGLWQPKKGKADKLTKKLGDVYAKLGSGAAFGGGGGDGPQEEAFYPYVYLPLNATASAAEA